MTILTAEEGKILTNGSIFGTKIYLAEGINKDDFYSLTAEEHELLLSMGEESEKENFWNAFTNEGQRTDYSYAFANWSQTEINPKQILTADKVIYMFMNCKQLADASNIRVTVKSDNPSLQGFCMGNVLMTKPPKLNFIKSVGGSVPVVRTWISAYANCARLKECSIYLGDGTQDAISQRSSMQNTFVNCSELENITFEGYGSPYKLDLSWCRRLTYESIKSLLGAIMDVSGATSGDFSIKIAAETSAALTDDDKTAFEALGWTIDVKEG